MSHINVYRCMDCLQMKYEEESHVIVLATCGDQGKHESLKNSRNVLHYPFSFLSGNTFHILWLLRITETVVVFVNPLATSQGAFEEVYGGGQTNTYQV